MAVKSIPFETATEAQKRTFANTFLNLELDPDANIAHVEAAIRQANGGDVKTIFTLEADEGLAPAADQVTQTAADVVPGSMQGSLGRGDPRWKIVIPIVETDDGSGSRDVIVGVNGRAWQMKRGVELNVPHRVVVALDLAYATVYSDDDAGNRTQHEAKRFSYQTNERPSDAAIREWELATQDQFCA